MTLWLMRWRVGEGIGEGGWKCMAGLLRSILYIVQQIGHKMVVSYQDTV